MLAFEVSVNQKRLCVAATGISDVLSTSISWVRKSQHGPDRISFNVGGITAGNNREHFGWTMPPLAVGDEVTIRLVDVDSGDNPEHVYEPALNPKPQSDEPRS